MPQASSAAPEPPDDYVSRLIAEWRKEWPGLPVDPVGVIYRVTRLAAHFSAEVERAFSGSGISGADFSVLAHLRRSGGAYRRGQRQLMDALRLTSGTISVRIDRLERNGLVRRDPDPEDGRGVLVSLTAEGRRVFEAMAPVHLANEARMVAALSPAQQAQLARLLQILLVEYELPAGPPPGADLGFTAAPAHAGRRGLEGSGLPPGTGLLVEQVSPGTPAAASGLRAGDVLVRCGELELRSLTCLDEAIADSGERITLRVQRGGEMTTVTISRAPLPLGR
jgi:DNA-binding MarR family transcriptional regulator